MTRESSKTAEITEPQIIADADGTERFAVLPIDEYRRLVAALEDAEDLAAADRARGQPGLSMTQFQRIRDGEHPLRVWREALGRSVAQLAAQAGVAEHVIRDIELGRAEGRARSLAALAQALGLEVENLLGPAR